VKRTTAAFLVLLGSIGLVYGYFLIQEMFVLKEQGILPNMLARWHYLRAFVSAMGWTPVVTAAVILVSFGLIKDDPQASGTSLLRKSGGMLVFIVIVAAAYTALTVFSLPYAKKQDGLIRRASAAFDSSIKAADKAIADGQWDLAKEKLDDCAIIDRNDKRYIAGKSRFDQRSGDSSGQQASPDEAVGGDASGKNDLSADEYYAKALQLKAKGDLYTAHAYATRATRIDPARADAQRLASEIWDQISTMQEGQTEKEQREIASAKMQAYKEIDTDPVDAYSRFIELKKRVPADADIDEYLKESLKKAKEVSFFKSEVTRLSRFPSARGVFFRSLGQNGVQYFVSCENAYFGVELAYMSGVECIRVSANGKPAMWVRAPYAKLQDRRLLLSCYDANDPKKAFLPVYSIKDSGTDMMNFIEIPFGMAELRLAAVAASPPGEATILELDAMRRGAVKIGIDPGPFVNEGLMRIQASIAFLLAALLSLYFGQRFRHTGARRPLFLAILAFPVSVFVAGVLLESWKWFNDIVLTILVRNYPAATTTAFVIVQAAALVLSFIVLAGYRDAPSD
jgi:tetratricopeptide (TPR) repeat protein